jgi:hypothetical protein
MFASQRLPELLKRVHQLEKQLGDKASIGKAG